MMIASSRDDLIDTYHLGRREIDALDQFIAKWNGREFSEEFYLRFLFARKFNVPIALEVLNNYVDLFCDQYNVHGMRIEDLNEKFLSSGVMNLLPTKDPHGRAILLVQPRYFKPKKYEKAELLGAFTYIINRVLSDPENVMNGIVVVAELRGMSWSNFSLELEEVFIDAVQNRYPVRVKMKYVLHPPWFFKVIWRLCSPFMKAKMRERMMICGGVEELFEHIPKERLPPCVGGHGKALDAALCWS